MSWLILTPQLNRTYKTNYRPDELMELDPVTQNLLIAGMNQIREWQTYMGIPLD